MKNWDKRYAAAGTDPKNRMFGNQPCEYLCKCLARPDVKPTSALCLADGDGRNGGWLAERGIKVTAVEGSAVATEQALAHDKARGVSVTRITADLATWSPAPGQVWDMAAMFFLQCEAAVRLRAVRVAVAALAPGGWFIAEGFAPSPDDQEPGLGLGPENPDLLYNLQDLLAAADGLEIVEAEISRVHLNEGTRHQGDATVTRLLLRKNR